MSDGRLDRDPLARSPDPVRALDVYRDALFRAIAEASADGIIGIAADGTIIAWNPGAENIYGYSVDEAVGRPLTLLIPPERHDYAIERVASFRKFERIEATHLTRDGREIDVAITLSPIFDADGTVVAQSAVLRDITADKRLARERERLAAAIAAAHDSIIVWEPDGTIVSWNAASERLYGYAADAAIGQSILMLVEPERHAFWRETAAHVLAGKMFKQYETIRVHKSGRRIDVSLTVSLIRGDDGRPVGVVTIARDITERKRAAERQRFLLNELDHRVKNTLAAVQSIATQSLRGARDPEAARRNLDERLVALAKAHDLLTRDQWTGVALGELAGQLLAPYGGDDPARVVVAGPELRLPTRAAVAFAMAFHELATNAAKYGALSCPEGRVRIDWQVTAGGAAPRLRLTWREAGGPEVVVPGRRGFGSRMVEDGLAHEFGGEVVLRYEPTGVVCAMDIPLPVRGPADGEPG